MNEVEIERLRGWIGREERQTETLTAALAGRFAAMLGTSLAPLDDEAPLAIHWCLT